MARTKRPGNEQSGLSIGSNRSLVTSETPYDGVMEDERDPFEEEGPLAEDEIEALQQDLVDVQSLK